MLSLFVTERWILLNGFTFLSHDRRLRVTRARSSAYIVHGNFHELAQMCDDISITGLVLVKEGTDETDVENEVYRLVHNILPVTAPLQGLPDLLVFHPLQQRLRIIRDVTASRMLDVFCESPFAGLDILVYDLPVARFNHIIQAHQDRQAFPHCSHRQLGCQRISDLPGSCWAILSTSQYPRLAVSAA